MGVQVWSSNLWDPGLPHQFELSEVGCGEMVSLTHPEVILDAHRSLLEAGADVISTNTFGANRNVMDQHGIGSFIREVNFESARLAIAARDEFSIGKRARWVAGSIGPTWLSGSLIEDGSPQFAEVYTDYVDQIAALIGGGVDILHIESCQNLMFGKAALLAARDVQAQLGTQVQTVATASIEPMGTMLDGSTYQEFCKMTQQFQSVICGLFGCAGSNTPEALFGNAFLNGTGWVETPDVFAGNLATLAQRINASIVGVSCGGRSAYVAALVNCMQG